MGRVGDINERMEGAPSPDVSDLLADLTRAQEAAVMSEATPLCIIAGAGSGKTRVLTRRIAYRCRTGRADAAHTLALTFTRKAASELQHRLASLGLRDRVAAGTFHSHASAQLQRWWQDRRQAPPTLLDRKSRLLVPILAERSALSGIPAAEVAGLIEWAKARDIAPDGLEAALVSSGRQLPAGTSPPGLAAVFARYENEKRRRGLVDFDDLLSRCAEAIERDPEFAGAQRWRWRHIYVDEFQDLNPLQHRLLLAWLGSSTDLCVVGDPNQAIYGWNGADPGLLREVPSRWPEAEVVRLDVNHRSTDRIVRAAAAVLGPAGQGLAGALREGPAPLVHDCATDAVEARKVAAGLLSAHCCGRTWSAMAVLTRTNAQLVAMEQALGEAGIPWWSAARAGLLDDPDVREIVSDLRGRSHQPFRAVLADLRAQATAEGVGTGRAIPSLVDAGRTFELIRPDATVGDWLDWLPSSGRDRSDAPTDAGCVTLCSFHRAKGLEWDLVWVAGVEEGLVPLTKASPGGRLGPPSGAGLGESEEPEAEERRLLYVALTRAVEELHVSWAAARHFGGRPVPRRASRWLGPIQDAVGAEPGEEASWAAAGAGRAGGARAGGVASAGGTGWLSQLADQREKLRRSTRENRPLSGRSPREGPIPDPDAVAALRTWRLEAARAGGVAPHLLLHDATIDALACRKPSTLEDLISVPGLGPVKARRFGPQLIEALARQSRHTAPAGCTGPT